MDVDVGAVIPGYTLALGVTVYKVTLRDDFTLSPQTATKQPQLEQGTCLKPRDQGWQGTRPESRTLGQAGEASQPGAPEVVAPTPSPVLWPAGPPWSWRCRWLPAGPSRWAPRPSECGNDWGLSSHIP